MACKKESSIDFEQDTNKPIPPADLAKVIALAEELRGIESFVDQRTEEIRQKMERAEEIVNKLLPDMMTSIGMKDFTLVSGEVVSIKDIIRGSIPSQTSIDRADGPERAALLARREAAFSWLRKNKAESLISMELVAAFGKGQGKRAAEFQKAIVKAGYPAQIEETVNHQTLNKFLRERIAAGDSVPEETFSLFTGKQAVITKPKAKKS